MPILRYSLLRVALVVAVWTVFRFVFDIDGLLPWILAFVIGFLVAFIAFPRTGDAAAAQLQRLATGRRRTARPGADETLEDELVEEALGDLAEGSRGPEAPVGSLEDQPDPEQRGIGDLEEPGVPEDGDERGSR
nr:hypothetical protein [Actinomycetales bacterium]